MAAVVDGFLSLNPKVGNSWLSNQISCQERKMQLGKANLCSKGVLYYAFRSSPKESSRRLCSRVPTVNDYALPDTNEVASSSSSFDDFTVISSITADGVVKLKIDASGSKTQALFDDVFSRLVAAAQPIPGFRRLKGGKTGEIPKDILMHILGSSKVNKHSIKKIINTAVSEYVAKENLTVTKDLKVDETFEELEGVFEPGKSLIFNVTLQLLDKETRKL
ncbi:uncharacterized protein LOC144705499 [Wolffia australiana]